MTVKELIAELMMYDPDAVIVHTSDIGWPTLNPLDYTTQVNAKNSGFRFPYWYEKVDVSDKDTFKAVVIY